MIPCPVRRYQVNVRNLKVIKKWLGDENVQVKWEKWNDWLRVPTPPNHSNLEQFNRSEVSMWMYVCFLWMFCEIYFTSHLIVLLEPYQTTQALTHYFTTNYLSWLSLLSSTMQCLCPCSLLDIGTRIWFLPTRPLDHKQAQDHVMWSLM
jgi:hypothetical protein